MRFFALRRVSAALLCGTNTLRFEQGAQAEACATGFSMAPSWRNERTPSETKYASVDDGEFRKIRGRIVGHAKHDQGAVVVWRSACSTVAVGRGQDLFGDFLS